MVVKVGETVMRSHKLVLRVNAAKYSPEISTKAVLEEMITSEVKRISGSMIPIYTLVCATSVY